METTWTRCSSGPRAHTANQAMAKAMNPVDMTAHSRLSSASVVKVKALSADRKSTRLNSSHCSISYAVFCLKKKNCIPDRINILFNI